jgi:hypothetical protein
LPSASPHACAAIIPMAIAKHAVRLSTAGMFALDLPSGWLAASLALKL